VLIASSSSTVATTTNHNNVNHNHNRNRCHHWGIPHKPTKIPGLPSFETLKELKLALEANASSVSSNLGGGKHGYLGAVIDAQTYAIIVGNDAIGTTQPFIIPTFPGVLPVVVEGNQATREEELHARLAQLCVPAALQQ
jgi:hypothetical protein